MTVSTPNTQQQRSQQRFQASLGRGLALRYAALAAEPVPEEFLRLLASAEAGLAS